MPTLEELRSYAIRQQAMETEKHEIEEAKRIREEINRREHLEMLHQKRVAQIQQQVPLDIPYWVDAINKAISENRFWIRNYDIAFPESAFDVRSGRDYARLLRDFLGEPFRVRTHGALGETVIVSWQQEN